MNGEDTSACLDRLDDVYAELHTAKEDAFWSAKMGLSEDANQSQALLDDREQALQRFLQDPAQVATTEELLAQAATEELRARARGWLETFSAHTIVNPAARALSEELTADEGRLEVSRGQMALGLMDPLQGFQRASSVKLTNLLLNEPDDARRRAAFEGLRSIESHVLEHGFLQLVAKRNRLGQLLGAEDYYDWKARRIEGMTKAELFRLLDELEERTRPAARAFVAEARRQYGARASLPWNLSFLTSGDVTRDLDPYFSFRSAVERWGRSFSALGVRYGGAELVLDLLDRRGKYENGFMHGPVVAWRRSGTRIPARIQFTANALPGAVGAGQRALKTLFHEGGHAAHFANIDMPSPCFGQEFAPTSTSFAETQSMFLDSLVDDPDWRQRYALDGSGRSMPLSLVERSIDVHQPQAAWLMRSMLSVCYAEKAIYELPAAALTPEGVLGTIRAVERRFCFLEQGSPRPTLSIPHLLSGESSATYHGYILAQMAVAQARAYFLERDGHLVDNPRVGPELARVWWQPGNSVRFSEFLRRLTGQELSSAALAQRVNQSAEQRRKEAHQTIQQLAGIATLSGPVELDAHIRIVHGNELVAELNGDFAGFGQQFALWIDQRTS